jgi:hypothetical protein
MSSLPESEMEKQVDGIISGEIAIESIPISDLRSIFYFIYQLIQSTPESEQELRSAQNAIDKVIQAHETQMYAGAFITNISH